MRKVTYTFNVLKLEELHGLNKRSAMDAIGRQMAEDWNEFTAHELIESMKESAYQFGMVVENWSFGLFSQDNWVNIDMEGFDDEDIPGALRWLNENMTNGLNGSCPFTGAYYDCLFFEYFKRAGIEEVTLKRDIVRAITYMLEKSIEIAENDILNDDEVLRYATEKELEFFEDGRIYHEPESDEDENEDEGDE